MAAENDSNNYKRAWVDSDDSPPESLETKRLRADLLDILDDVDFAGDRNPAGQDLATVMKFFEEEITPFSASNYGESQPDLGYLLEASDFELGLPPPTTGSSPGLEDDKDSVDVLRGASEAVGFGHMWGFEDDIPSYDALEIRFPEEDYVNGDGSVVFEGLFDYPDFVFGTSDFSDVSWRQESLPSTLQ